MVTSRLHFVVPPNPTQCARPQARSRQEEDVNEPIWALAGALGGAFLAGALSLAGG